MQNDDVPKDIEGKAADLPRLKNAPQGHTVYQEATVDATPQLLSKRLRSFDGCNLRIPATLGGPETTVLRCLFDCFTRAGEVKEGLIGDVLWGFSQMGHAPGMVRVGLTGLEREGYIRFQAPDNQLIQWDNDQIGKAWVRYTPKLLAMVYDKEDSTSV